MSTRINIQWHVIAIALAIVVFAFRGRTILEHQAWSGGKETVLGKITNVAAGGKYKNVKLVDYSYEVDGKTYTGNDSGVDGLSGMPRTVTYAKSNPAVSTLTPESIDAKYRNSILICLAGALPMLIMLIMEILWRMKGRPPVSPPPPV